MKKGSILRRVAVGLLAVFAVLVGLWVAGRLFVDVQMPPRNRVAHAPVADGTVPGLREVFDALPETAGGRPRLWLLDENVDAWAARWQLLAGAEERLDICYFILEQDLFGMAFLGHLLHKTREGVRIRILLDAIGTSMGRSFRGNDYLDALVNTERVSIKIYRPLLFRYLDAFLTLNPAAAVASNHDKILLADGRRALIGGRNISEKYFSTPEEHPLAFHDADVVLVGADVGGALEEAFTAQFDGDEAHDVSQETLDLDDPSVDLLLAYQAMDAWLNDRPVAAETVRGIRERNLPWLDDLEAHTALRGALLRDKPVPVDAPTRIVDSRTRLVEVDDPVTRSLINLVRSAQDTVFILSPYLVLFGEADDVLVEAAARGVEITVVTNSPVSSDNAMSQAFFLERWPEMMARIPTLRLFVAGDRHNLHAKLGTIDDQVALIGTYNLDPLSMAVNGELVAVVWSEEFARRLQAKPRRLIEAGAPEMYEYRIARDESGAPIRNEDGEVVTAFGPRDHSSAEQWEKVQRFRLLLRIAEKLPWL